jgi:hypothetical protein
VTHQGSGQPGQAAHDANHIPVLVLISVMSPQGLGAQQADTVDPAQTEMRQRLEAQAQAQLELLRLQRRQLEEQGNQQIRQLKEQATEQIEQAQADANRQIQQVKMQVNRQIQQVEEQVKRQAELLEAQMKIIQAQAGIRSEPPRGLKRVDRPSERARAEGPEGKALAVVSPGLEQKLDRLLNRLEHLEKRLDRLARTR